MYKSNYCLMAVVVLLLSAIAGCSPRRGADIVSTRFQTDSMAILATANQYKSAKEYDRAIALLDSAFRLPVQGAGEPGGLSPDDARRLMAYALRNLMFTYNQSRRVADGHEYFARLRQTEHPILSRYCRREMLICDAQMLMALGRRAEACALLDEAMGITENDDPGSELFCAIAAGITYMTVDSTETRAEPTLLRAVEAVRGGAYDDTGLYPQAMANLANLYIRKNDFERGINLCQEVLEQSERSRNPRGIMLAAINLAGNYFELNNHDKALHYIEQGLQQFSPDNDTWGMAASLYERRAGILKAMGQSDSAFQALNLADSFFVQAANPRGQIRVMLEKLDIRTDMPDSLAGALADFEKIRDEIPGYMYLSYYMNYGKAMYAAGRYADAIPLLEEAVSLAQSRGDMETENHNNRLLLDSYHKTGRLAAARQLLPRYNMIIDSVTHEKSIRESIASHIRYETEKVEQQNRLLSTEVALHNSIIRIYTIATIALIFFILLLATWFLSRHRALRLHHQLDAKELELTSVRLEEKEKELKRIIQGRRELHERNRDLLRQLNDIQATTQCDAGLDALMETLTPAMLTPKEEQEFRTSFSGIYPMAIPRLREACPGITRNEELLCMLVFLNQTTEEIARILGIATPSVFRIRYRLRPKMNISEKAVLDVEIKRIMNGR